MAPSSRTLAVSITVAVAILAAALHGIDNLSSLNLVFPVVLDAYSLVGAKG
jgi:hypothetical protein